MVQPIPTGYHTITSCFTFKDSNKAIEYYTKAFNAELLDKFPSMDGQGVMHATMKIGDSIFMMGDEMDGENSPKSAETLGSTPNSFYLYVPNVDAFFEHAMAAGGKVTMPVMDMFWGDRAGQLIDPFGYSWMIATHTEAYTMEQMKENAKEFFASMQK